LSAQPVIKRNSSQMPVVHPWAISPHVRCLHGPHHHTPASYALAITHSQSHRNIAVQASALSRPRPGMPLQSQELRPVGISPLTAASTTSLCCAMRRAHLFRCGKCSNYTSASWSSSSFTAALSRSSRMSHSQHLVAGRSSYAVIPAHGHHSTRHMFCVSCSRPLRSVCHFSNMALTETGIVGDVGRALLYIHRVAVTSIRCVRTSDNGPHPFLSDI